MEGFQQFAGRYRLHQIAAQHLHRARLALNRQPDEQVAFERGETGKLLVKHLAHAVKNGAFCARKRGEIAAKEIDNGGGRNL